MLDHEGRVEPDSVPGRQWWCMDTTQSGQGYEARITRLLRLARRRRDPASGSGGRERESASAFPRSPCKEGRCWTSSRPEKRYLRGLDAALPRASCVGLVEAEELGTPLAEVGIGATDTATSLRRTKGSVNGAS